MLDESAFVAIGFVIFVALAYKKIASAVADMLDQRSAAIRTQLEEAKTLREEAAAELTKYQKLQRDASKEAKNIIANAEAAAERIRQVAEERAKDSLARREAQANAKIKAAEEALLAELRNRAAVLASEAAANIIAEKLDAQASLKLVDDALAQISARP
ncbi:MAG: ATP synthase F0 subunit B [Alphaproteobacteria bacterium]|jgi:F-type H+-transporting ATPase subunit b|nr:ATP synthase F0 subunit B [Alphaproteobacteria bacterium]